MNAKIKETKYPDYYATVSGKILSKKVKGGQGRLCGVYRELKYKLDRYGYLSVCLSTVEDGIHKRYYIPVHKLVYETFYGEKPKHMSIDHIDNNRLNNSVDNLQLLTPGENSAKQAHVFGYGNEMPVELIDLQTGKREITTCRRIADKYNMPIRTVRGLIYRLGGKSSVGILNMYGVEIAVKRVEGIERVSNT